jgi:hypothetical protein
VSEALVSAVPGSWLRNARAKAPTAPSETSAIGTRREDFALLDGRGRELLVEGEVVLALAPRVATGSGLGLSFSTSGSSGGAASAEEVGAKIRGGSGSSGGAPSKPTSALKRSSDTSSERIGSRGFCFGGFGGSLNLSGCAGSAGFAGFAFCSDFAGGGFA